MLVRFSVYYWVLSSFFDHCTQIKIQYMSMPKNTMDAPLAKHAAPPAPVAAGCGSLTHIALRSPSLVAIGQSAFAACTSLTQVTLGDHVEAVGSAKHTLLNQNGATSGFEMCFAPSTFDAAGPNQNTSRFQHKEIEPLMMI